MIWGSGGSKSRLAKAAGAEPAGQMRDEKLHAVVARSAFASQNVQNTSASDHFWKLRCRKSARRCGAKHICKSKCTKHLSFGPLLEVVMSKKCTPLWREAHLQVKMYKTPQLRTTFGSCDVEKVHAVVARSTFPSQNVQNTSAPDHFWKLSCGKKCTPLWREAHLQVKMCKTPHVRATFGGSDVEKVHVVVARSTFRSQNVQSTTCSRHFWRFGCWKSARRCGAKHISKSKWTKHHMFAPLLEVRMLKKCTSLWREAHFEVKMYKALGVRTTFGGSDVAAPLRFTTLHYVTLHHTPLYYTTLHYTTLHKTTTTTTQLDCTPLHSTTLNLTTLHYITLHYAPQHYNYNYTTTLHYTKLHYTTLHYTTLHPTTLHSTTLHYITLHYLPLHFTTLQYTTLHYTTATTTTTQLHSTTRNYNTLHYITLHYTTFHYTPLHYITLHYNTLNDTAPQIDR